MTKPATAPIPCAYQQDYEFLRQAAVGADSHDARERAKQCVGFIERIAQLEQQLEGCAIVARDYKAGVDFLKEAGYGEQWKKVAVCRQSLDAEIEQIEALRAEHEQWRTLINQHLSTAREERDEAKSKFAQLEQRNAELEASETALLEDGKKLIEWIQHTVPDWTPEVEKYMRRMEKHIQAAESRRKREEGGRTVSEIQTGDVVMHRPTGERWVVACVENGRLSWCGWPEGMVPVGECELKEKASDEERYKLLRELASMNGDDHRKRYAERVLSAPPSQPHIRIRR